MNHNLYNVRKNIFSEAHTLAIMEDMINSFPVKETSLKTQILINDFKGGVMRLKNFIEENQNQINQAIEIMEEENDEDEIDVVNGLTFIASAAQPDVIINFRK